MNARRNRRRKARARRRLRAWPLQKLRRYIASRIKATLLKAFETGGKVTPEVLKAAVVEKLEEMLFPVVEVPEVVLNDEGGFEMRFSSYTVKGTLHL